MELQNFSRNKINLIDKELKRLSEEDIINRIWNKDYKVWNNNPEEISNRLGWLDCSLETRKSFAEINSFADEIKKEGFKKALLLGMGGSSLAPEVFSLVFGAKKGYLNLSVVDSTHPEAILDEAKKNDPEKTLYIVSTKSGGTVETISFMKYFYNYALSKLGKENVAKHLIAITDPGSGLEQIAKDLNFRKIFLNDPDIGGRFSALSLFGIVPAALIGVDIERLFQKTDEEIKISQKSENEIIGNESARFGIILGTLAKVGIDKLTLITSKKLKPFGAWVEQLIAESTGKADKGILPVDLETIQNPEFYGKDRLFVYLKLKNDNSDDKKIKKIITSGFPFIEFELESIYDLGKEFFKWEFATAIAGRSLGIQPFDQPNVEQAKVIAKKIIKDYHEKGKLDLPSPILTNNNVKVISDLKIDKLKNSIPKFLEKCKAGKSYVALQAYIKPTEENFLLLQQLRTKIQKKYKVATTLGFGPRFLHSTGQLHKGDSGNGYFIQFISDISKDSSIPDNPGEDKSSISFGVLIRAQAYGDRQALIDNKRKVITFEFSSNIEKAITQIMSV
jgi:glucose-6-phosphate isomerase